MSQTTPISHHDSVVRIPGSGPKAHEDLTITEILKGMLVASEHRPGEQCFVTEDGRQRWVSEGQVHRFTTESGALHPSDYIARNGIDWQIRFFNGF